MVSWVFIILNAFFSKWYTCYKVKDGNNNPVYETAKETLMYRTVLWTLWERERVGRFGRMALKHVKYHGRNELPVQVQCTILDAWGWCTGMAQRDGMGSWLQKSCSGNNINRNKAKVIAVCCHGSAEEPHQSAFRLHLLSPWVEDMPYAMWLFSAHCFSFQVVAV